MNRRTLRHASVFSGIGGPEVAAAMLGWDNVFHCEINSFCREVLGYWFPASISYEDITKTDFTEWKGKVDVLSGGFPCQPFSLAGRRGGAEERKMTAISGRKCLELYRRSDRLGLLVRTLLESHQWFSPARLLEWRAKPLYSERITQMLKRSGQSSSLRPSVETLSEQDIPSSRLLFQLVPLELPTGETGCFSSLMLKTPSAMDARDTLAKAKQHPVSGNSGCLAQEIQNGYAAKRGLMLPTPTARDYKPPYNKDAMLRKDGRARDDQLSNIPTMLGMKERGGIPFQLSPLFVTEMMGFPLTWLTSPFLTRDGDRKQSRRAATP